MRAFTRECRAVSVVIASRRGTPCLDARSLAPLTSCTRWQATSTDGPRTEPQRRAGDSHERAKSDASASNGREGATKSDGANASSAAATTASSSTFAPVSDAATRLSRAVRDRNLQAVLQRHWRDEYVIPLVCFGACLIVYYTTTSAMRNTLRRCLAAEQRAKEELQLCREQLQSLSERWVREVEQRDNAMKAIQEQNMDLVKTVDHMTVALKQCTYPIITS